MEKQTKQSKTCGQRNKEALNRILAESEDTENRTLRTGLSIWRF